MMSTELHVVVVFWATWVAWNLALVLLAVLTPCDRPCCNGFAVLLPDWLSSVLDPDEVAAVAAHERGHLMRLHVWSNLFWRCVMIPPGAAARRRQEWAADDYAASNGHGLALASALLKLSKHPDDVERAARLIAK
jgi:Zn-dependent protease with chaperone function